MRSVPIKLPKQPKLNLGRLAKKSSKKRLLATVDPRRLVEEKTPSRELTKICPKCGSIYYDKKWYAQEELARHLARRQELRGQSFERWFKDQLKKARSILCEADRQNKNWAEGVVVLEGLNGRIRFDVLNLIKNIDREGRKSDVEDRVIALEDHGERVVVYTSENQLAHRIGKQVASAFKGGKLEIKFSDRDDATRVHWTAPKLKLE